MFVVYAPYNVGLILVTNGRQFQTLPSRQICSYFDLQTEQKFTTSKTRHPSMLGDYGWWFDILKCVIHLESYRSVIIVNKIKSS